MAKVLVVPSDNDACGYYRMRQPYIYIKSDIEFIIIDVLTEAAITDPTISAVMIQRPMHPELPQFIKDLQAEGKKVVIETDDDIPNIPANNVFFRAYNKGSKVYSECLKLADYVHVSTPELMMGNKSSVFFNAVDVTRYGSRQRTGEVHWHGSPSHAGSLDLIRPVIYELMNNGIKVVLMGNKKWLSSLFKEHENLTLKDWVKMEDYYLSVKDADVFLTPLPQGKFNSAKSELKCVESAAWGIPSVSSDIAPYRRFNKLSDGGNVLVKKEKPRYWIEAIMRLMEDEEHYNRCSEKSRAAVQTIYNIEIVNKQRIEFWNKICHE